MILKNYRNYGLLVLAALLLTVIGTLAGLALAVGESFIFLNGFISIILAVSFIFTKGKIKRTLFFVFSFWEGFFIAPLIHLVLEIDAQIIIQTIGLTFFITAIFLVIGLKVKDLSWMGGFLFYGTMALLALLLASLFLPLPGLCYIGAGLYSLYVSYHMNEFKRCLAEAEGQLSFDEVFEHALLLYLSVLNLFIHILEIVAN